MVSKEGAAFKIVLQWPPLLGADLTRATTIAFYTRALMP